MARKKTTKDYGDRQFNKMVKALKLSEEEVIDLIGGVRRNKKTGQIEHHKKGGPVVKAKVGKHIKKGLTASYKAIADKLKSRKSKPKKTTATRSEAKLVEGSGDMSDPTNRAGKMRTGTQQRRGGATSQARDAMSDREKDKLARSKAARGSYKRSQKLKKGSLAQLSDEFDKLLKGRQRAERVKGSRSKYYKVFKARNPLKIQRIRGADGKIKKADTRGYTDSSKKTGGPVVEKKFGKLIKGAVKSLNKKRKKKPFDPAERSAKDAYIIGGTGTVGIGGAGYMGHKDAVKKSKQKKEGRSRNIERFPDRDKDVFTRYPIKKKRNLKRKGGGKITYRMPGGQVVDAGYD